MRCLAAIRDTLPAGIEAEVLVLDNASGDGSAEAVREWNEGPEGLGERLRLIALDRRRGKAENDSTLLAEARGEWCLLLNEDSELCPGAIEASSERSRGRAEGRRGRRAAPGRGRIAIRMCVAPAGRRRPRSSRPSFSTGSWSPRVAGGQRLTRVGWVQSAAMLVRRSAAAEVGYLDPDFFVYSDETDFQKRLHDAGWSVLFVPGARAVHHEQLTNDRVAGRRRLVEFHRNRDLYMRKHHGAASAARGTRPHRLDLRGARARRAGPARRGTPAGSGSTPAWRSTRRARESARRPRS